ncbi:MAG: homoserine kinase [Nitrospirae bacterium]|nr:homoserine kinase [Nitrospirota bacterium]
MKMAKAFAPASIGNIGPGFDVLGMAITGLGDTVTAEKNRGRDVVIREIKGGDGTIPLETDRNTAGIAAKEVLKLVKAKHGVDLIIQKNIPGTGLGSSAASAVAAAVAVNALFGNKLDREELIPPCAAAEHSVSGGYFIDNVSASLFGGIIVSHAAQRQAFSIGTIPDLVVVVVTPYHSVLTKISRAVLPDKVPLSLAVSNMAFTATMVAAVAQKNARRFGLAIQDGIVEPARAHLIPGFPDVKAAALKAGALGASISGAGASVFAVTDRKSHAKKIGLAMQKVFQQHGISSVITVSRVDKHGARVLRAR